MAARINRAIELLEQNQPIYYDGGHTGHTLTYEQGKIDALTWADYINVGMEHGSFNMFGLDQYMKGLVDGGPTKSGHLTPTVIIETPVEGISENIIRFNAWQFRQVLARGIHGILLCQAETPDAVRAFIESCRYPINKTGVNYGLDQGTRGTGGQPSASVIWGINQQEYTNRAEPWPLNPEGELLLGIKIESARSVVNVEQTLSVPGIGFAEMGPGDLHMSYGIERNSETPLDPRIIEARERVFEACKKNNVAFLETASPEDVVSKIDEGVKIIAGQRSDTAEVGRKYTKRLMPI